MCESLSEGDLVRRIADGREGARAAEAELCRRFLGRARLYGLRHLRSDESARDLAQTVMLAVLEATREGRIDDPEHLIRFILGTCRNTAQRMREREERTPLTADGDVDLVTFVPELEAIDIGILVRCLAALDARSRSVVHLSFHEERTSEQVAALLETTPGNVRVLRHRAIADLRRCIDRRVAEGG
jgi:RNA polymerase sigma-70 factor (ECF subfamily)